MLPSRDPSLLALQDPTVVIPVSELNPQTPSGTEHTCVYAHTHTEVVKNAEGLCLMEGTDGAGALLYCKLVGILGMI